MGTRSGGWSGAAVPMAAIDDATTSFVHPASAAACTTRRVPATFTSIACARSHL